MNYRKPGGGRGQVGKMVFGLAAPPNGPYRGEEKGCPALLPKRWKLIPK